MAYKVSLAPAAEGDLEQIFAYLAPKIWTQQFACLIAYSILSSAWQNIRA